MTTAAPVIQAEMDEWVDIGGGNSGIVGDKYHDSGFHCAANDIPASDYSRRRDPNGSDGPYVNWNYACAGDFRHGGNERLRAMHRTALARLMHGEFPMICEFIGKPWADRPVYYWSRWGGLSRYTGSGHDTWSHISWYRSRADQFAHLWTPDGGGLNRMFARYGEQGEHVKYLQSRLHNTGFDVGAMDGDYGPKTAAALAAMVKAHNGRRTDGRNYGWAEMIYLDVAWSLKYGSSTPGPVGPPGPPGPKGDPGELILPVGVTFRGTLAPVMSEEES